MALFMGWRYVDFDYTARVGRLNLLSIWSIANAPDTPANFTHDVNIGFLTSSLTTHADLFWRIFSTFIGVRSLLNHCLIVSLFSGRCLVNRYLCGNFLLVETNTYQWTHMLNVGAQNNTRLPISKDNAVFRLRAVGKNGKKSLVTYALAVECEYFGSWSNMF